jgi:putative transcriptional regulator
MEQEAEFLEGRLLVAMPGMGDPRFEHAVIYICAHNDESAMGLIVNKPAPDVRFGDLLEQLNIPTGEAIGDKQVYFGGPVEHGRGFVLHSGEYYVPESTLQIAGGASMTATVDILRDIASSKGPKDALMTLGYSGWGPGQLESELQANGWLTCDADEDILFHISPEKKWEAALRRIGIDPRLLSSEGGRA